MEGRSTTVNKVHQSRSAVYYISGKALDLCS